MKLEETKSIYIYISMHLYINIAIYISLSIYIYLYISIYLYFIISIYSCIYISIDPLSVAGLIHSTPGTRRNSRNVSQVKSIFYVSFHLLY